MDADPVLDPDEELAAEREYDSLVASAAEARAIEEAEAELRTQDAATLPEAGWSRIYTRLLVEHRSLGLIEAWRVANGAPSYECALLRVRQVQDAKDLAAEERMRQTADPAMLEVIHSPDLFSVILGYMPAATLGAAEATCRTWRRRVADNQEWARRLESFPWGNHDAPAELRQWGAWEGEHALTTRGNAVSAKGAFLALSAISKPVPKRPPRLAPEDVAIAAQIFVETPMNEGVPIDRNDPKTFRTSLVYGQVLPLADAQPIEEAWVHWAGGHDVDEPQPSGVQWACELDTRELLQMLPTAALPTSEAALARAIHGMYSTAYVFDQSLETGFAGRTKGEGAKRGAMVYISMRAFRRSDKKVVPLLDKAPLRLSYGAVREGDGLEFEPQSILQLFLAAQLDNYETMIGAYMLTEEFPMRQLYVRADVWPLADSLAGTLRWQLGLQFLLGDLVDTGVSNHDGAAPCVDMLKLLSMAHWQG